jgi:lysophospholipase L1-like esterase
MQWTPEQTRWLVKVFQPEKTVASLPGGASLNEASLAGLLGLDPAAYASALAHSREGAKEAAQELLAEASVRDLVSRLPLRPGAKVVVVGDSLTSDPQSWAVILGELLTLQRPHDNVSLSVRAVSGETTTHVLVRMGEVTASAPDWVLFFIGLNDARTQGPHPTKTLVGLEETARNLAALRERVRRETQARRLWVAPPEVVEERVTAHWALSRFGVGFRNHDVRRVGDAIRSLGEPTVELLSKLDPSLFVDDGLHLTLAGQKRVALEVLRAWSVLE